MIGSKIKALRESKGFSQYYMATALDASQSAISRMESGVTKPHVKKLKLIATLLGVTMSHFFEAE